jgi:putative hemolysin
LDDPLSGLLLAGIGGLILAVFLLSLSEAALVAVSRIRLRRLVDEGDRRAAAVLELTEEPTFLSAIIVAINIAVITISCLATLYVRHQLQQGRELVEATVHLVILAVILVVAEITPKNIGASYPTAIGRWVSGPIHALTRVLGPLVAAVTAAGNLVLRGAGIRELQSGHFVTQEDLKAAVDVGEEEEVLEPDEGEMFDSALALAITSVRRIMVPRVDVVALEASASVEEALTVIQDSGFSRVPIYRETIDEIIGILYANDLLRCLRTGGCEGGTVAEHLREAMLIPETKPVDEVFREMREHRVHIAVVIGEQGGTEGIVTIEDILEELVGEIEDEHDTPGEEIQPLSENEAIVLPKTRIEDVNAALQMAIPGDEHETIAGYVSGVIGRIPDVGETIRLDGVEVTVEGDRDEPLLLLRVLRDQSEDGEC